MGKETSKNIRLGIFVASGAVLLIFSLYMIGNNQNLFGKRLRISAEFYNVSGLMVGNNVRFSGIDVGTVESIEIVNDSSVMVVMVIDKDVSKYIKNNSIASIGTDGLMGNRLVNINTVKAHAASIQEGDKLFTIRAIEQDEMIRTLNATNENMKAITSNLRTITDRINSENTLWSLLMDTAIAQNVKSSIVNIKIASSNSAILTGDLKYIMNDIRGGKSGLGALITDTSIYSRLNQIVVKFNRITDTTALVTGNISSITRSVKNGEGSTGIFLKDTTFVYNLNKSMESIKSGSKSFSENMEALKHTWPFKKYFKRLEKKNNQ